MKRSQPTDRQQSGFVAIFSVLIIMGILTLLVLGFSNITRQAQKRALDDHLSTQAMYAAESGINIVASDIAGSFAAGNPPMENITDCDVDPATQRYNKIIDAGNGIGVSCLLVDMSPGELEYSQVPVIGTGEPIVTTLEAENGNIGSITIEWDAECDGSPCPIGNRPFSGNLQLPSHSEWGRGVGMLRVDLTPRDIPNLSDRDGLVALTRTFYLYPTTSATGTGMHIVPNSGLDSQGAVLATICNNSTSEYRCRAIVNLNTPPNTDSYYMRLTSYYNPPSVRVTAYNGVGAPSGSQVDLINGQAVIDATGRANDVYRRLQARVPIDAGAGYRSGLHQVFSLYSGDSICKRYLSLPGSFTSVSPANCGID